MTPAVTRYDDLPTTEHAREFVGADHEDVPFSIILVDAPPSAGLDDTDTRTRRCSWLSREATVELGTTTLAVHGGEIVVGPANIPHGFTNTGSEPLRLIAIHGAAQFDTEWLGAPDPIWASMKPPR